jgi:serine/threonine protein kinase
LLTSTDVAVNLESSGGVTRPTICDNVTMALAEAWFQYTPPTDQPTVISLVSCASNTDLYAVAVMEQGCDPQAAVLWCRVFTCPGNAQLFDSALRSAGEIPLAKFQLHIVRVARVSLQLSSKREETENVLRRQASEAGPRFSLGPRGGETKLEDDQSGSSDSTPMIVGAAVGGLLCLLCLLVVAVLVVRRRRQANERGSTHELPNMDSRIYTGLANTGQTGSRAEYVVPAYTGAGEGSGGRLSSSMINSSPNSRGGSRLSAAARLSSRPGLDLNQSSQFAENSALDPSEMGEMYAEKPRALKFEKGQRESPLQVPDEYKIRFEDFSVEQEVGRGSFGVVYRGTWNGNQCAVKRVLDTGEYQRADSPEMIDFQKECSMMFTLGPHPNLIQVYGVCVHPLSLLLEWASGGSLDKYLQDSTHNISVRQQTQWCLEVATGLQHLHQQHIIHRDLAARNVLLTDQLVAKISDMGMSRPGSEKNYYTQSVVGPLKWMAPEAIERQVYNTKTDLYSLAVVFAEIFKRSDPYPGEMAVMVVMHVVQNGRRPELPKSVPPAVQAVIKKMWDKNPAKRPELTDVAPILYAEVQKL